MGKRDDRIDLSPSSFLFSRETETSVRTKTSSLCQQSEHTSVGAEGSRGTGAPEVRRPSQESLACQASHFVLQTKAAPKSRQVSTVGNPSSKGRNLGHSFLFERLRAQTGANPTAYRLWNH